jgi:hypothetical protein
MEDLFFKTEKERDKFRNNLALASIAQLSSERQAVQIVSGKRRPDFSLDNNFIACGERILKASMHDDSLMDRIYKNCLFRKLKFINKYKNHKYTDEGLDYSKTIRKERFIIAVQTSMLSFAFIYGVYRFLKMHRSSKSYFMYGFVFSLVSGYFVGNYSSSFIRNQQLILSSETKRIPRGERGVEVDIQRLHGD